MENLATIVDAIRSELDTRSEVRDQAIRRSRTLIRYCANSIRAMHRREFAQARDLLETARQAAFEMVDDTRQYPSVYYAGYTQDALKEFVEAQATYALLHSDPVPTLDTLGVEVDHPAYLKGLAEAASEMRRAILDTIRKGDFERGEALLTDMEEIYAAMITIDFPDAVTSGLRRTTDALRAVLERTRGDLTVSMQQEKLRQALSQFEERVTNAAQG
ncbi:MAG: haloacid dehalogenase [Anaerolineae bacterium]|nr:haloacid dehalogenase [Anaerolineae bacterium]